MANFIEDRKGVKWVVNPVNPLENFADKWPHHPQRQVIFYEWLRKAQQDFGAYASSSYDDVPDVLVERMTERTMKDVLSSIVLAAPAIVSSIEPSIAEAAKISESGQSTRPWKM